MEQIVNGGPDLGLGFDSSFFKESSYADKGMLTDVLEKQQESLRKLAGSFKGKDEPTIKRELLNFMKTSSQELKDVTRKFVFASPQMQSMDVVKNARTSEIFAKCDLHLDAGVRSMIMEQMVTSKPTEPVKIRLTLDLQETR